MGERPEWLESQARLVRRQIEQEPEALREIYEADVRVALAGRSRPQGEPPQPCTRGR